MSWIQDDAFIQSLYIIAFALFIYGLMGLTGPHTAVRGNKIAALGMAVAVGATLLTPGMGNWWLILLGAILVTGTTDNDVALVVGLVAIVLAAVNMVGGFVVTDRMLQMFTRRKPKKPAGDDGAAAAGSGAGGAA